MKSIDIQKFAVSSILSLMLLLLGDVFLFKSVYAMNYFILSGVVFAAFAVGVSLFLVIQLNKRVNRYIIAAFFPSSLVLVYDLFVSYPDMMYAGLFVGMQSFFQVMFYNLVLYYIFEKNL